MTGPYAPHEGGDQPPYPAQGQSPYPGPAQPQYPPPQYPAPPPQPQWGQPAQYGGPPGQLPLSAWGGQAPEWATATPPDPAPKRSLGAKVWPKVAGILSVLVALAVFGLVKAGLGGWLGDGDGAGTAYPTASQPSGISATSTATAAAGGPFAGTPAADYPQGAAGITLPKAAASGVFSAKQVAEALASVKKALIAGRLDSQMLVDRDPDPFLRLVAPDAKTGLRKDFSTDDFSVYATQFAPGAKPAKEAPRVKGRVTYRVTRTEGIPAIEVTTNFVWVYPFQASGGDPGDNLVVVHDELVWQVLQPSKVEKTSRGLWLNSGESYASNIDCDQFNKGLIAPGKPEVGIGTATEDPDSMFDPNRTLDIGTNC